MSCALLLNYYFHRQLVYTVGILLLYDLTLLKQCFNVANFQVKCFNFDEQTFDHSPCLLP